MAARKKSTKRSSAKKRPAAKSSRAKSARSKKSAGKARASKRRARKTSTSTIAGFDTVLQVGERTWKTLKNTTAKAVEGVKETFGG